MTVLKNSSLIKSLLRQPTNRRPIWLMRQAGRYLPEYKALRETAPDFMTFCKTPALACEATLQPLRRFDLDAAIVFSDILTVPNAMGMSLQFESGEGPRFDQPVRSMADVQSLVLPNISEAFGYLLETIEKVTKALGGSVPLIGFAGSPWTVATYMVEGQGSKTFLQVRQLLYQRPEIMITLLERLTHITVEYLNAQITAGARVVMLFDTWGGLLTTEDYEKYSLHYMQKIAAKLLKTFDGETIPVVFFTKHGGQWLEKIAASGCHAVGLDWTVDIKTVRERIGNKVALQGNLDPALLFASPEKIQAAANRIMQAYGKGSGHIFNLGHGIDQFTPIESVTALIEAVHRYEVNE